MADPVKNKRLVFERPFTCVIREEDMPDAAGDQLLVKTACSAISAGTEMLIFQGRFPEGMAADATLPSYQGRHLAYPLTYGYSSVGIVEAAGPSADPAWVGQRVFAFQPHQSHFAVPVAQLIRVPAMRMRCSWQIWRRPSTW